MLNEPDQFEEYFSSVAFCAMNSVFSINTKYEAVVNALNRFCGYFELPPRTWGLWPDPARQEAKVCIRNISAHQ
jgi:hypothetical protein